MFQSETPYTLDSVVRMALGAGLVVALIWLLGHLSSVLVPFVAALIMAYLLNPVTCFIEKYVKNRAVAAMLTLVGVLAAVVGAFMIVVPMMVAEFAHMGEVLSKLVTDSELAGRVAGYLPPDIWKWVLETVQTPEVRDLFTSDGALGAAKSAMNTALPGLKGVAVGAWNMIAGLMGLFVILLYLAFLLVDFGNVRDNWQEYLPKQYRDGIVDFLGEFEKTMSLYFRGQIVVCLIVGVLMSIGFALIGMPLGIVLGMLIGVLNIAPYLGVAGMIPAVLLAGLDSLESGESVWIGIGLAVTVMTVVQIIQDGFLVPKIQGDSLGLSPWLILLSLSVWGKLLGFLGLLIALPMTCLCLSYYRRLLAERETA